MTSFLNCVRSLAPSRFRRDPVQKEWYRGKSPEDDGTPSPPRPKQEHLALNNDEPPLPQIQLRTATLVVPTTSQADAKCPAPNTLSTTSVNPNSEASSLWSRDEKVLRSRASSKGSDSDKNALKTLLKKGRRECPRRKHSFFVPRSTQDNLITVENVSRDILATDSQIVEPDALECATDTCERAKQLYAVLAYLQKGPAVRSLLHEDVTDKDLPLTRGDDDENSFALLRKNGDIIKTFEAWTEDEREDFDRIQWWMALPVFELIEHYEMDEKMILPFLPLRKDEERKPIEGAYGEVYPVRLHPSHHKFWEPGPEEMMEPLIAVKKLFSSDEEEFNKEVGILKTLGSKSHRHPHLIRLLATYRQKEKYHLMFPYANANLRKYWEDRKVPEFDEATVLWSMRQMTGIASALKQIHHFQVTIPLKPAGGETRMHLDAALSVRKGEELFGRHGDIKPENILWFDKGRDITDEGGILQIADFGLGRFHGRDSRSYHNPNTIQRAPTYEPPECMLHRPVSRAYDLWSLGALYLEFVTWLLKGNDAIEEFSDKRGMISRTGINDDNFFTIRPDRPVPEADVRQAVIDWVDDLHQHERCSTMIHDILDLTMKSLVVIEPKKRCPIIEAHFLMERWLVRAEKDQDYWSKPAPHGSRPNRDSRAQSASSVLAPSKPVVKRTASTADQAKAASLVSPPLPALPAFPSRFKKDLVLREAGTPGMKIKKGLSVTWPQEMTQTAQKTV